MSAEEDRLPVLQAELARLTDEAQSWLNVEASDSTAIVAVNDDPEALRRQMVETRREARKRSKELAAKAEETRKAIRAELDRQRALMEQKMREAEALLAPLKEQVARMEEGIWTVNLYLGTSEEMVTLRDGEPASIDEPIALRIGVLNMDEEVAAFPVERGEPDYQGMDYRDLADGTFDEWITDPKHLDQMIPERRGIVVFRPRATDYHYDDDPLVNDAKNEPNRVSYWLIRNGERVYRMVTDFRVGSTLMPTSREFTALFQTTRHNWDTGEYETVDILPGSREWAKAEKAQGARQRHYMRVALILQGLIDRTDVFMPIPSLNVMQQRTYDDGLVVIVDDVEKVLTTSRTPYYEWIKARNAELRPGMRIIGTFKGAEWEETKAYDYYGNATNGNDRLSPTSAERPPRNALLTIEDRRQFQGQKGLVVRYERGAIYDRGMWTPSKDRPGWGYRGGERKAKRRASAVILPTDISVIPFDVVTEAEMQEYLDARMERHAYKDSFPLLQSAIDAKRAEREAEKPFRDLLARVLADDTNQEVEDVEPHIDDLVHRYKLGNRWHRPLVSLSQEDEAKALRLIRAEYKRIADSGATAERDEHAVAALREHDPEVMFVGRLSSGKYVAFAPQKRARGEVFVHPTLWVREHTTGKTARTIATREWLTPGVRGNKMTEVYSDERWIDWDLADRDTDLTDEEFETATERAKALAVTGRPGVLLAVIYDRPKRRWTAWIDDGDTDFRGEVAITRVQMRWTKRGGVVSVKVSDHPGKHAMEMSYAGNSGLDRDWTRAFDRDVYLPWNARKSRRTFSRKPDEQEPESNLLFEADKAAIDALVLRTRQVQAVKDVDIEANWLVYPALEHVDQQQKAAEVQRIKAEFLVEWIDEELWEDKREHLTNGVRASVPVGGRHEHSRLNADLRTLIAAGHREDWHRLTVADVYRLIEEDMPAEYAPIASLLLMPEPEPEPEPEEEDEFDDDDDDPPTYTMTFA